MQKNRQRRVKIGRQVVVDLSTNYLGLSLANPVIASSSPLTGDIDIARQLEDIGVSAIVMPSLFEESLAEDEAQMHRFLDFQDTGFGEANSFLPEPAHYQSHLDDYLNLITRLKRSLSIPVIGSLNGVSLAGWLEHAKDLEAAGCDALELNIYYVAADTRQAGADIERHFLGILEKVRAEVAVPLSVKLSHSFSSPGHFVRQLEQCGADGVVLFNRFYLPDIDLEALEIVPKIYLSSPTECLERIRWLALLRDHVSLNMAASGGFYQATDVVKALLAGADVVCLCSVLLQSGVHAASSILEDLQSWLVEKEYHSVAQLRGSVSQRHAINPVAYEHSNYQAVLSSYAPVDEPRES